MMLRRTLIGFSLLAFAGANAYAQSQESARPWERDKQVAVQPGEMRASSLQDMKVVNAKGEDIGEINDIVVDLNSGRVHAAVLGFGGFMGIGEDQYAFPIRELKSGKQANQVVLNIDKQALESRRGFAKDKWPGMEDEYWTRVDGKQAGAGAGAPGGKMHLARSSELIGKEVQDRSGKNVGEVQDLVVGLQRGEVRHIVVDLDEGGRTRVPGTALKSSGTGDRLVLDMSAGKTRPKGR